MTPNASAGADDAQDVVDAIVWALAEGQIEDVWPELLQVADAVDELTRWVGDDRQWGAPRSARHWRSLVRELNETLAALGPGLQTHFDAVRVGSELERCAKQFDSEAMAADLSLRRRLTRVTNALAERARDPGMLEAGWRDLVDCAADRTNAAATARRLLSMATWVGHDASSFAQAIRRALDGERATRIDRHLATPVTEVPLEQRLEAAAEVARREPSRAHLTVWLRFRLARVRDNPVIAIGDDVRIYAGDWLRSCLCRPAPHQQLPEEATGDDAAELRRFCGVEDAHVAAGGPPHDPAEVPRAFIRVVVGDEFSARAVEVARSNAEAVAALGAVYGEEPGTWQLDRSYVVFSGSREVAGGYRAEEPQWTEQVTVREDRTSDLIRDTADRLAGHLPVRDEELERATMMLGWLRGARSAPLALRLVLCDRVMEAVCGWAGLRSRDAFVRHHLMPWWAQARVAFLAKVPARQLLGGGPALVPDDPSGAMWEEIMNHEPLGLRNWPRRLTVRTLLEELPWLLERVPHRSEFGRSLVELDRHTRYGRSSLAYWDAWCRTGERIEVRRLRTRNLLAHGGPLAPATVASVTLFAEHLASQALITSLHAKLAGKDLVDHFLDRQEQIETTRDRLRRNEPSAILFEVEQL